MSIEKSNEYKSLISGIKIQIKNSRQKALLAVNKELLILYWNIGSVILNYQDKEGWGAKVIDNIAKEIKDEFPDQKGFSTRNLKYMRKFAEEYKDIKFVQQVVAQIPWSHNVVLMDRVKDIDKRIWYINKTIENGWSRNTLVHQIESNLFQRQNNEIKTTNFMEKLEAPNNKLAVETLKDPYIFDFITMTEDMNERDIENQLVKKVTKLLLELGSGFAFIGNQYKLQVGNDDYYLDLLFYNLKLRCYVVIELKTGKFKPEYAGKLNFYLSAVDDILKTEMDNPSIGIILCKEKNRLVAEYSLKDITKPIGVSEYKLLEKIPEELKGTLPTIEEIEDTLE
ncbi:PDDEXK nuclease domain-containing protein [Clostridium peptidivorans]|uniref:PDDEXK nuclease domain-containing protein n=1 Tax=Clostridium peptidivorans TaxID=100174 RepID=UPI000BE367DE|nr:PDDEXK nuclease domain-containing protein [Clostridium peptidivorans]